MLIHASSLKGNSCAILERIRKAAMDFSAKKAVANEHGAALSYAQLWREAEELSKGLLGPKLKNQPVAINYSDSLQFTKSLLAIWMNESIAIPLHESYPQSEIDHRLQSTGAICTLTGANRIDHHHDSSINIPKDSNLILFTSGSTGKPKGVVHTSSTLQHQLQDLQEGWQMSSNDHIFHTLPLNHIHGLVTGLLNALWMGASVTIHSKFDAEAAHATLTEDKSVSFFTAVPTIYSRLLPLIKGNNQMGHLRAMISGSSALPARIKEAFKSLGLPITERYGMTETGMISTKSIGSEKSSQGVGKPFPSITVKAEADTISDIYVKGPGLFCGYLKDGRFEPHKPDEFFRTGDQGYVDRDGHLQLCGRDRDIFKVAGFKVAAGEIESALAEHSAVVECVACALPEKMDSSSQTIATVVKVNDRSVDAAQLKEFLSTKLAYYKIPRKWLVAQDLVIPRNLIGKPDIAAIQNLLKK